MCTNIAPGYFLKVHCLSSGTRSSADADKPMRCV